MRGRARGAPAIDLIDGSELCTLLKGLAIRVSTKDGGGNHLRTGVLRSPLSARARP